MRMQRRKKRTTTTKKLSLWFALVSPIIHLYLLSPSVCTASAAHVLSCVWIYSWKFSVKEENSESGMIRWNSVFKDSILGRTKEKVRVELARRGAGQRQRPRDLGRPVRKHLNLLQTLSVEEEEGRHDHGYTSAKLATSHQREVRPQHSEAQHIIEKGEERKYTLDVTTTSTKMLIFF